MEDTGTFVSVTRVAETLIRDIEVQDIDEYRDSQIWFISGNLKQDMGNLKRNDVVILEINLQENRFSLYDFYRQNTVYGKIEIAVSWNMDQE